MGYKLAGYDVVAANDIDTQMAKVYKKNHHPKHFYECPIKDLIEIDLPDELMGIDILDGSPPCSTFSMSGSRDNVWGKEKMFREGQAKQVLDDLFFDFIRLADKIRPKVIIAENVKGMMMGNAKGYLVEIKRQLNKIGYSVQLFLLNAASMGVPQKRERIFFVCLRKDLNLPMVRFDFDTKSIRFKEISNDGQHDGLSVGEQRLWENKINTDNNLGDINIRLNGKNSRFNSVFAKKNKVLNTITAAANIIYYDKPQKLNTSEYTLGGSFPGDYDFMNISPRYLIGMSVPPVMMANVAYQVYLQIFHDSATNLE